MEYIKKKHIDRRATKPFSGKYSIIDLSRMLTYPRPAGSKMEEKYIHKFIDTVPGMQKDKFGNRFIKIGKQPTTIFASHTDTVHSDDKKRTQIDILRNSVYDPKTKTVKYKKPKPLRNIVIQGKWAKGTGEDILGADDTTGNWLMLNLIHEKKPGLYIFHRAEETGREGSEWIAKNRPKILKGMKRVISFDRKGYEDIITHQMGYRTASDKFAKELARRLGSGYKPDPTGSFTDSMSYAEKVPECTNISIGYKRAHSTSEKQNLRFARHLYTKLRDIDFETLPVVRKPEKRETNISWINTSRPYTYGEDYYNYWSGRDYASNIYNDYESNYYKRLEKARTRVREYEKEAKRNTKQDEERVIKKLFGEEDNVVEFEDNEAYKNYIYRSLKKKKKEGVIE